MSSAVLILSGSDEYTLSMAAAEAAGTNGSSWRRVETTELDVDALRSVGSPSLFGPSERLVITDGEKLSGELVDALVAVLGESDELAVVAMVSTSVKKSSKSKAKSSVKPGAGLPPALAKLVKAGASSQTVAAVSTTGERAALLSRTLREYGLNADAQARTTLLDGEPSTRGLVTRVAQLADWLGKGGTVEVDYAAGVVTDRAAASGFAVSDAVLGGERAQAQAMAAKAVVAGLAPLMVLGALNSSAREVARVRAAARRGVRGQNDLAAAAGVPPWKASRLIAAANRLGDQGLARWLTALGAADTAYKSGRKVEAAILMSHAIDAGAAR